MYSKSPAAIAGAISDQKVGNISDDDGIASKLIIVSLNLTKHLAIHIFESYLKVQ